MIRDVYSISTVRRAAWLFVSGKAASVLMTFVIMLSLVRMLPVTEYGAYIVFIAAAELGIALAGLGLPWVAARFVPEYCLRADGSALARICIRLAVWQLAALVVVALLAALALDPYLRWTGLADYRMAAGFALVVLVIEGWGRFLYDAIMAPLMFQKWAQLCLLLRQFAFLTGIAVCAALDQGEVLWVLAFEAAASTVAWVLAGVLIWRHLRSLKDRGRESGWIEPRIGEQLKVALRMHAAHLISLAYSPQVFLTVVQRTFGAEASALFGFIRLLFDQIARNLPATLIFTVLRPKIMASHIESGIRATARQVNLAGKVSLLVLLPLAVGVALGGDPLLTMLSGGKFSGGGDLLFGLLLALVPVSQRQLIETVAVAVGRPGLCTIGSALGGLALPLFLLLLHLDVGLWSAVLAIIFGQVLFSAFVLWELARIGYRIDWQGVVRLSMSAIVAWILASIVLMIEGTSVGLAIACVVAAFLFLALVWRLRVFTREDCQSLDAMLGRRLFVR